LSPAVKSLHKLRQLPKHPLLLLLRHPQLPHLRLHRPRPLLQPLQPRPLLLPVIPQSNNGQWNNKAGASRLFISPAIKT
jgi:hypothetical protein